MITVVQALIAHLGSVTAVSNLVGERIYGDIPPQGELAAQLVITLDSTEEFSALGSGSVGVARSTVEITARSGLRATSDQAAAAVRAALLAIENETIAASVSGGLWVNEVEVGESGVESRQEPPRTADDSWRYHSLQKFKVFHAVPAV